MSEYDESQIMRETARAEERESKQAERADIAEHELAALRAENARLREALEAAREELTRISIMLYGQIRGFVTPPISDKLAMESLSNKASVAQRAITAALEPHL